MSKRTKALQISPKVRKIIKERDKWCVACGKVYNLEIAHYISRGAGGLGIPENLILLCRDCHREFDQSRQRGVYKRFLGEYLKNKYEKWNEKELKYKK